MPEHLRAELLEQTIPVYGRMMHSVDGELTYQPYGKDESECNYSVSRGELNKFLLSKAEAAGARLHFDRTLADADLDAGVLCFDTESGDGVEQVPFQTVFGCDGAPSALRRAMQSRKGLQASMELLEHGYKELLFPATSSGGYAMEKHALHIWPRGRHMLMGLPNLDGSFTGTIYLPNEGDESFQSLSSPADVEAFFGRYFADTLALMPDLSDEFLANPVGVLGTVRAWPWSCADQALLIGDASHAIVPFFGQGLNSGFEDCALLIEQIEAGGQERSDLFTSFASRRKPSADAIADMALENFVEMRDLVGDPAFLLRKRVEHRIETLFPERYRSRYAMVMYSFIPYRVAFEVGLVQRRILDALCADIDDVDQADMEQALRLIDEHLAPVLAKHEVDLGF